MLDGGRRSRPGTRLIDVPNETFVVDGVRFGDPGADDPAYLERDVNVESLNDASARASTVNAGRVALPTATFLWEDEW